MVKIGSRYWESRRKIISRIISGEMEIQDGIAECNRCYFCRERIKNGENMKSLTDRTFIEGVENVGRYTIHDSCYQCIIHTN